MIRLTVRQIQLLHRALLAETGGLDGVRDLGLLESAVQLPFQTFGGQDLYPSVQRKAAQLAYALVRNHPFLDGNKRSGVHAMLVFLAANGVELTYTQEELIAFGLALAAGELDGDAVLQWILRHQS